MASVVCKFRLNGVETWETSKYNEQEKKAYPAIGYTLHFTAVYSTDPKHENKRFWDATPGGEIHLKTINEEAAEILIPDGKLPLNGKEFYVIFSDEKPMGV